jgi:2,3-bisphosphoglycerate-independent phosphoglycerate mutase
LLWRTSSNRYESTDELSGSKARGSARRSATPILTQDVYGLNPLATAVYTLYCGLARLVGMSVVEPGKALTDQMNVAEANWATYNLFFILTFDAYPLVSRSAIL